MYGPCLSAIVGGRALTPPTRHSLGSLLHYQQADRTQATPKAINPALNVHSIKYKLDALPETQL